MKMPSNVYEALKAKLAAAKAAEPERWEQFITAAKTKWTEVRTLWETAWAFGGNGWCREAYAADLNDANITAALRKIMKEIA